MLEILWIPIEKWRELSIVKFNKRFTQLSMSVQLDNQPIFKEDDTEKINIKLYISILSK